MVGFVRGVKDAALPVAQVLEKLHLRRDCWVALDTGCLW